jgi:S-formylglutathione hydrolase FrmB
MRYSYCWDVTAEDLHEAKPLAGLASWDGSHVRFHGGKMSPEYSDVSVQPHQYWYRAGYNWDYHVLVTSTDHAEVGTPSLPAALGRVANKDGTIIVDRTQGRITGQSVAGLVVGAMGALVFACAVRHWQRERRACRADATAGAER